MSNGIEEFAFYNIQDQLTVEIFHKGFINGLRYRRLLWKFQDWTDKERDELNFDNNRLRVYPDAFYFDDIKKEVTIFEIEDTSPLAIEKINKLYEISTEINEVEGWILNVIITDRYGLNWRKLPIDNYEMILILKNVEKHNLKLKTG